MPVVSPSVIRMAGISKAILIIPIRDFLGFFIILEISHEKGLNQVMSRVNSISSRSMK